MPDLGLPAHKADPDYYCVKEAVMPWGRFPGARVILGPEMKSTGEVMGIAPTVPAAYAKTQFAIRLRNARRRSCVVSRQRRR